MQKRIRVYVAGPLTVGDTETNIRTAVLRASELVDKGYYPFVPHLTHFWGLIWPRDYEQWLQYDFEWLSTYHALFRLKGESPGADREEAEARRLGIPVFYSISELEEWANGTEETPARARRTTRNRYRALPIGW